MKEDCNFYNCKEPIGHWMRIDWQKTKNVSIAGYCSEHATKVQLELTKLKLANVREVANRL